ncbi:endopeptidase La [Pleionea sp. CnH1-48]|uniref:endopeptidase La n=1 Tax=Pleionea sp. CnH1-48 TaxID=2954494 RepID=UPI002096EC03|nr:endopeptidase La [Pleionea sp. CnH1-48]MCO7222830.1 endopeptidase La [Pleionea sp. CnH1-48]
MADDTEFDMSDLDFNVDTSASQTKELSTSTQNLLPTEICLLPLSERPFFPPQTLPILMNEEVWRETIEYIADTEHKLAGLVLVHNPQPEESSPDEFNDIGTLVRIHHPVLSAGKIQFIAEGVQRFRIVEWLTDEPPFLVKVEYPQEPEYGNPAELKAYAVAIINTLKELVPLNPLYSEELKFFLNRFNPNEPSPLTDFAASLTTATREDLQLVLEQVHLRKRMEKVLVLIKKELEVAQLQNRIRQRVEDKLSEHQRKFFLREQLKAIQKELGIAKDDKTADIERFQKRLKPLTVPEQALKKINEEIEKLSVLEQGSPEYAVTRNYLDVITALPWGIHTEDHLDLKQAREELDKEHAGLDDVKDRIVEFLAVGALTGEIAGSILLLVGPPGVGKTSIGRSIANALGRKFFRFSLGGMRDEAEIKGHRKTYIGAMPGKLIQALKDTESSNPVIMLDEIDKVGASYQGDPASALLEVLDPEQNHHFLDHYIDAGFDLSKVLFICTANQLDTIPRPLLDRMETIRLSGYITQEKVAIAREYLWPRQRSKCGLKASQVKVSDTAFSKIIEDYAREAGVRNLDKQLGRIARKAVVKIVSGDAKKLSVTQKNVADFLGTPWFQKDQPDNSIGVVTGLAWTALGGSTLNIEAAVVHSKNRGFQLTGKLGAVMKESAEIANAYISANMGQFGADETALDQKMIHLHVPEGATPKDGPSAGITMATALLSLARNKSPKKGVAMTGELTLTGKVLAVGGIREKIIAAKRAKIKIVLLPIACEGDYKELPDHIKEGIEIHFVSTFADVVDIVF